MERRTLSSCKEEKVSSSVTLVTSNFCNGETCNVTFVIYELHPLNIKILDLSCASLMNW